MQAGQASINFGPDDIPVFLTRVARLDADFGTKRTLWHIAQNDPTHEVLLCVTAPSYRSSWHVHCLYGAAGTPRPIDRSIPATLRFARATTRRAP